MKMHSVSSLSLLVLCLALVAVPAIAQEQVDYDNGPVNGQVNARPINFGYTVTDNFQNNGLLTFSGFSFWVWYIPGDSPLQVEVSIGSTPYGSDLYDQYVNLGQGTNCFTNRFGYNVCLESVETRFLSLSGTTWLTLQNASTIFGLPLYWDQNSGAGCMSQGCPSKALQKYLGCCIPTAAIPSEAFTTYGFMIDKTRRTERAH